MNFYHVECFLFIYLFFHRENPLEKKNDEWNECKTIELNTVVSHNVIINIINIWAFTNEWIFFFTFFYYFVCLQNKQYRTKKKEKEENWKVFIYIRKDKTKEKHSHWFFILWIKRCSISLEFLHSSVFCFIEMFSNNCGILFDKDKWMNIGKK